MEKSVFLMRFGIFLPAIFLASWWVFLHLVLHPPPPPSDPLVRIASEIFQAKIQPLEEPQQTDGKNSRPPTPLLEITHKGALQHDHKTLFWNRFGSDFGSNPNTPYMYNTLPLFGNWIFPLLSPMWNIEKPQDAVVLIAKVPPKCEYFSLTTFALWVADGRPGFPFASLGDSVNHRNIQLAQKDNNGDANDSGLFAHVVTVNAKTANLIETALVASGIPKSSIHFAAIPKSNNNTDSLLTPLGSSLRYPNGGTFFEVVMRLFRFHNQTLGDQYLASHPPVFYIKGLHNEDEQITNGSSHYYKDRSHPDNVNEVELHATSFEDYGHNLVSDVGRALRRNVSSSISSDFKPLMIRGLDCLKDKTDCLGDCPDAAYFGPNIHEATDDVPLFQLEPHQLHVVTMVDHKAMNTSIYSSIAILKPPRKHTDVLSKSHMTVRSTQLGVTSWDFENRKKTNDFIASDDNSKLQQQRYPSFVSWAFTRDSVHCDRLLSSTTVDGCTVVGPSDVPLGGHMTYCERVYLNPVTGLGPDWNTVLPARLYSFDLDQSSFIQEHRAPSTMYSKMKLPEPIPVKTYNDDEPFRLLHIIKTGGESLQNYLDSVHSPRYSFESCRASAITPVKNMKASTPCFLGASIVSSALCGLNCECCAKDIRSHSGVGFHGTLIRSPRAHALSLFSHGHSAHYTTYRRILTDLPLYLAEGLLRLTEHACGSYCTGSSPDWKVAMKERLLGMDPPAEVETKRPLRVLPLENTQSHALTCSKSQGSLSHHFRIAGVDSLEPNLEDAISSLSKMEWVGITDLMEPSLCLLHFQANGTLPSVCDCNSPQRWATNYRPLGQWREYRYRSRSLGSLSMEILSQLDDQTKIDRKVFVEAVRLLLGRLKYVQDVTGSDILSCIDWNKFHKQTEYIEELWVKGAAGSLLL